MTNQTEVYYLRKALFEGLLSHEEMKSQLLEIRKHYKNQHSAITALGYTRSGKRLVAASSIPRIIKDKPIIT